MAFKYLVLGITALTLATGCASGISALSDEQSFRGAGGGPASPSTLQDRVLNCRNRGVYNRAADLCVSEGP